MSTTISKAENLVEMIVRMPSDSVLTQHGVSWEEYEELLDAVGESSGLRISFDDGRLQIIYRWQACRGNFASLRAIGPVVINGELSAVGTCRS